MSILNFGIVSGQNFNYPAVNKHGSSINDFIPYNWKLRDSTSGDLNNDGKRDYAIILQYKDSIKFINREESIEDTVITQPRILIILFKSKFPNEYTLSEQSNSFILNHDNSSMDDPYQSIKISKEILKINFQLFYNMGSWQITNTTYEFKYQNMEFNLIGAYNYIIDRSTHDDESYDFNFLSKILRKQRGNADGTGNKFIRRSYKINLKNKKNLKTFLKPYTWEVMKGVYI